MKKLFLFIVILSLVISTRDFAQDSAQDSLKEVIKLSVEDTVKVNALIELAISYRGTDSKEVIRLASEARDLAEKITFRKGLATAYKWIGMGNSDQDIYVEATLNWNKSLKIFEEIGDKAGVSNILSNLGTIYNNQGDDEKALELYLRALKIAQEIGDNVRTLTVSLNIGLIYQKKPNTLDKALEYYFIALPLAEEMEYADGIGTSSVNIGEVYMERDEDSLAFVYFEKSRIALENSMFLPYTLMDLGKYYTKIQEYDQALKVQNEAYSLAMDQNSKLIMAQSLIGMSGTYIAQGRIREALEALKKAEEIATEVGSKESLKEAYEELAVHSADLNDFQNAYYYQKLLTDVKDSLFRNANEKRLNLMLTTFDLEQKQKEVEVQELTIQKQRLAKNAFLVGLLFILAIAFIIFRNYMVKVKINRILDKQNEEIDGLLMNILPEKVARELQKEGHATPRDYESVSVLFTDFVGFSSIAKTLDPNELVNELSSFFVAFDNITEKHNLEKIKTIGDAYMCAGGIPSPNESHPHDAIKAGLEMQDFMRENNIKRIGEGKIPWQLRVGIHTGPVVAGVVGRKKYAYDIWGSTVNIASRMESNGEPEKVNISESTYQLVMNEYLCHHRGKISAKNVGEIDMYFVDNSKLPM